MLLKNPLGKRRRVGGRDWGARRLYHWLRFSDPEFPLLRQADREVQEQVFDVSSAVAVLDRLAGRPIHLRTLPRLSPFSEAWIRTTRSAPQRFNSPPSSITDAVFRLETASADGRDGIRVLDEWLLTPDRIAVHLPTATAVLADLHLGYDAVRRAGGEAVPERGWEAVRQRLNASLHRYAVRQLLVAGDLVEDARWIEEAEHMASWLSLRGIRFGLVPGNHDSGLRSLEGVQFLRDGARLGRWLVLHEPRELAGLRQVCGHLHPAVRLTTSAHKQPCFLVREDRIILPAFTNDAAGVNVTTVAQWRGFSVYAPVNGKLEALGSVRDLALAHKVSA
jgi:putative SbcD/Mre11-related phosphoesterase